MEIYWHHLNIRGSTVFMLFVFQTDYSRAPVSPLVPMLENFSQPRRITPATVYLFRLLLMMQFYLLI